MFRRAGKQEPLVTPRRARRAGFSVAPALVATVALFAACATTQIPATSPSSVVTPPTGSPATPGSATKLEVPSPSVGASPFAGASRSAAPDLDARPLVWFSPLPPLGGRTDLPFADGSADYFDLFAPDADWATAAQHVAVFKVTASWISNYATDQQLRDVIEGAAARGMALGLEVGPLQSAVNCGTGEGFNSSMDPFQRVEDLGGKFSIVAFDEPYGFAHAWTGPNPCGWSVEQVAASAAAWVSTLHGIDPTILVGDIEPMWGNISAADLGAWMDAYRDAVGSPFDFFQLDADWSLADWPERAVDATEEARSRGIPVGLIYNGGEAPSDAAWNDLARERIDTYEARLGGPADHLIFQSWMDHPDRVLPDSDPTTFTGLIRQYFGARSVVTLGDVHQPRSGRLDVSGTVSTTPASTPIPGATVLLTGLPLDGAYQVLSLEGKVPAGATTAVVGLRANTEEAGPGPVHVSIYELRYVEDRTGGNRVPDPHFTHGEWAVGVAHTQVVASDRGAGSMLRVDLTGDQALNLDSPGQFPVDPGAHYRFSVGVRVPEASAGNAYIAVIFLSGTEIERDRIGLAPQSIPLGEATAASTGTFLATGLALAPGTYRLRVEYPGDSDHWHSAAETTLRVE
jgi:hypothetical protein